MTVGWRRDNGGMATGWQWDNDRMACGMDGVRYGWRRDGWRVRIALFGLFFYKSAMHIAALQKSTFIDYPGTLSAMVFTQACNFRCPYCHNPQLLHAPGSGQPHVAGEETAPPTVESVLRFLDSRKNRLQGLVISGGEPTLQPGLPAFCRQVKALGYRIKLDSNGSRPQVLQALLSAQLVDYVAMDIKAPLAGYAPHISREDCAAALSESIALLDASGIAHEFRTSCAAPFVCVDTFAELLDALPGRAVLYLQPVRLQTVLAPDFFAPGNAHGGRALSAGEVARLAGMAQQRGLACEVRPA